MHRIFWPTVFLYLQIMFSQPQSMITDHGVPVRTPNRISYKTALQFGSNKDDLLCWTTTAESGGHFIAMNLKTKKVFIHPLNHLEAYPIVFGSNGMVYIGSTSGYVMVWNPVDDSWNEAGDRLFGTPENALNHVRVLCEGLDGWLYAGSCYGERARLNMANGTVEFLPKIAEEGKWYVSAVTTLPDGKIAFGMGYKSRIVIYDPQKRKDVGQWMPLDYQNDGFCFNIISGKKVVYATHFPSGHRLCFDAISGIFLGKIPWPEHHMENLWSKWNHSSGYGSAVDFYINNENDAVITYDGNTIHQFHPKKKVLNIQFPLNQIRVPKNLDLALQYEVTNDCRVIRYDYRRNEIEEIISPILPSVERNIFSLTVGPDNKVYGGAYQSTLLFRYDPKDEMLTVLGDHHPGWSGETFSYTNRGEELICASYTNGAVVAYNPFRTWDCTPNKMINPHLLGFLGQYVYRPTDLCVDGVGDIWGVGPSGWGTTGGGIAKISYSEKEVRSHNFNDIPHSILPVTPTMMVLCSDTLIRWWDTRGDSLISQIKAPFIVTSLCRVIGETDTLYFLSSTSSIYFVKLNSPGEVIIAEKMEIPISISRLISNNNKDVIIAGDKGIGVMNPRTRRIKILTKNPINNRYAFTSIDSTIYFCNNGHLLSLKYSTP